MAVAPLGFEETLVEELRFVGVECVENCTTNGDCAANEDSADGIKVAGDGKVEFTAKITEAWKAVAYSRIANRVLMEIGSFKAENFGQLEKGVVGVPWELFLESCANLELHVSCKHSRLYHSGAIEERVAPIIAKALAGSNPDTYPQNLYINLQDDRCTLWLDLAGEELYKRGHERFVAEAPLKETIAAAMIFEASQTAGVAQDSFVRSFAILDGMAGSGTFSLEAAYIANGLIPGKSRDFALKHQPAFKEATWNFILKGRHSEKRSDEESTTNLLSIITSDISERPISIIKHNVEVSPLPEGVINPQLKDFFSYTIEDICAVQPPEKQSSIINHQSSIILLNPPYGKRLAFDAPKLYTKIGQKLNEFKGAVVAILAPKDCTENLLKACPALDPKKNKATRLIETSHGGFSLNAIFARI